MIFLCGIKFLYLKIVKIALARDCLLCDESMRMKEMIKFTTVIGAMPICGEP